MPVSALLVRPPLIKSLGQPSLGLAMLRGAGLDAGHRVDALDLSQRYLLAALASTPVPPRPPFLGDHDRDSALTRPIQAAFLQDIVQTIDPTGSLGFTEEDVRLGRLSHAELQQGARRLARGPLGCWLDAQLAHVTEAPSVVGISVMFSGQVLAALALTLRVRARWPTARIVWGRPHVTALKPEIAADFRYAATGIDAFVFGYAEQTWVDILDTVDAGRPLPPEAVCAGSGAAVSAREDATVQPHDPPQRSTMTSWSSS